MGASRRGFMAKAGALVSTMAVGALAGPETARAEEAKPAKPAKRVLTLRIQVPANLDVRPVVEQMSTKLKLGAKQQGPARALRVDLTTAKTAEWFLMDNPAATTNACCVRG